MAEIPLQSLQEASGDAEAPIGRINDPVGEIDKLLNPDPPPVEPPPETGDQAEPPSESWDLKSLAEKLGTDPEKLYNGVKVAMTDGSELTLSALKDSYRPAAELEKARAQLTEEMSGSKREVAQAHQELAALVSLLDRQHVTPGLIQEAQRLAEQQRQAEADKLLTRIPEWKDPVSRAADWSDIRKVAREYGYSDAEIALAGQGYADHRMVALLRALARQPQAPAPAKPAAKVAAKPTPGGKPTAAQQFGQLKAAVTTRRMSPEAAVAQLLKGI